MKRALHLIGLLFMQLFVCITPKKKRRILFYSKPDFSDNSRALYEELLRHPGGRDYEIVWLVNGNVAQVQQRHPGITCYRRKSVRGFLAFAFSAFVIRSHMLYGNVRAKRQKVLLTMHGMGIKGPIDHFYRRNTIDYITVSSDLYRYRITGRMNCLPSRGIITGLPRNDFMFAGKHEQCLNALPKVRNNPGCKTIVWMPTFHKNHLSGDDHGRYYEIGLPVLTLDDLGPLNDILKANNIVMLVKLHPHAISEGSINSVDYSNIQVFDESYFPGEYSLYHLLGGVDALLTDYSSVFTDFMLLDRPLAFIYDDFEEYSKRPGFSFERVKLLMPGPHLHTYAELAAWIESVAQGRDPGQDARRELNKYINFYNDDRNSYRTLVATGLIPEEE